MRTKTSQATSTMDWMPILQVHDSITSKSTAIPMLQVDDSITSKSTAIPMLQVTDSITSKSTAIPMLQIKDSITSKSTTIPKLHVNDSITSKSTAIPMLQVDDSLTSKSGYFSKKRKESSGKQTKKTNELRNELSGMIQDRNEIAQRKSEIMEEAHQASMIEHKLRVREMEARAEHDQQMWALDIKSNWLNSRC